MHTYDAGLSDKNNTVTLYPPTEKTERVALLCVMVLNISAPKVGPSLRWGSGAVEVLVVPGGKCFLQESELPRERLLLAVSGHPQLRAPSQKKEGGLAAPSLPFHGPFLSLLITRF